MKDTDGRKSQKKHSLNSKKRYKDYYANFSHVILGVSRLRATSSQGSFVLIINGVVVILLENDEYALGIAVCDVKRMAKIVETMAVGEYSHLSS
jgi:beta-galactosidase beta subunit